MKKILIDLRRKSLFSYILAFSAIVFMIILVMGAYLYRFYYNTIYNDFVTVNEAYLTGIRNRHDNDLAIMNDIVVQMRISGNNVEFKLDASPLKSIALEEQLYRYTSVSQFFNQTFFFYHEDNYLYNHNTSIHIDMFLSDGILLEETDEEEIRDLLYDKEKGMRILKEQGLEGYLSTKFSNFADKAVIYFKLLEPSNTSTMVFIVDNFYYDNLLISKPEEHRQNYIIYDGEVIVSRGYTNADSSTLLQKISDTGKTNFQTDIDGTNYLVTLQQGSGGVEYCTIQSMDIFKNKVVTGHWGILLVLSICSIPTSLAIVALSRQISRKVRTINQLLSEENDHFYDLQNIETGIRNLVEHNNDVSGENLLFRRNSFINKFIRNEYEDREEVIAYGDMAELRVNQEYYAVILMGSRESSNESKAHDYMLHLIECQETLDGFGIHLINENQSLFVVFGGDTEAMNELLESLFNIGSEYCEDFVMAASGFHAEHSEASNAYLEANSAFDSRFLVDNSRIIRFEELALSEQVEIMPDIYLHRLRNAIRANSETEAKTVINEICSRLQTTGHSLLTFRILCNDIIHMMISEWSTNDTGFDNIYNVFALSQCLTIQDFNDILWDVCSRLILSNEKSGTEKSDMVTEAIQYMKSNYKDPNLNMSTLAEYLSVTGVTLALEFKEAMGISPSDYLAITRIENAKALLKETDMLVKDVSVAVGYEDDHVFMRRFKKHVGKTPKQYRLE